MAENEPRIEGWTINIATNPNCPYPDQLKRAGIYVNVPNKIDAQNIALLLGAFFPKCDLCELNQEEKPTCKDRPTITSSKAILESEYRTAKRLKENPDQAPHFFTIAQPLE